ncbi:MAG: radical SAM protein, partial [Lachnospirales bacterium]
MLNIINKVLSGQSINYDEAKVLINCDLDLLCKGANEIRNKFCGNKISLCSIISGKSGNCSENCKFCAQSAHYNTNINSYEFIDIDTIYNDSLNHYKKGVHRYSIVTSGRTLNDVDFEKAVKSYKKIHKNCPIDLCGSHGLLSYEQLENLKENGVTRYHCNIETSREYFKNICTTHTFD